MALFSVNKIYITTLHHSNQPYSMTRLVSIRLVCVMNHCPEHLFGRSTPFLPPLCSVRGGFFASVLAPTVAGAGLFSMLPSFARLGYCPGAYRDYFPSRRTHLDGQNSAVCPEHVSPRQDAYAIHSHYFLELGLPSRLRRPASML